MIRTLVLRAADAHGVTVQTDNTDLDTYNRLVGGYIEPLRLPDGSLMLFNEEGKIYGLPVNESANRLIAAFGGRLPFGDQIVGDVVVVGPNPQDPTLWGPVTDALLETCETGAGVPVDPDLTPA